MSSNLILSTVENVKEVVNKKWGLYGTMTLLQNDKIFFIHWTKLSGTKVQNITAVYDYQKPIVHKDGEDDWVICDDFSIPTSQISFITFHENPEIQFTIKRNDKDLTRTFLIDPEEHISFILFLQQLLKNGICVPSLRQIDNVDSRYNLDFYQSAYVNTFLAHPIHIQMSTEDFKDLEELWNRMFDFLTRLIAFLDVCDALPIDPQFPINVASRAIHSRVVEKINKYIKDEVTGKFRDITVDNYKELFDESGRVKDEKEFKERLFHANTDPLVLPELLPLILNVYPLSFTKEEKEEKYKILEKDFKLLEEQLSLIQDKQLVNHESFFGYFKVIENDVRRTDRNLPAFKNDGSIGLQILSKLLRMYVLYNPPISYLQGMNDLFVPIILAYFPAWTEEGIPIDPVTKEPVDYEKKLPIIFWCFDCMLNNTKHTHILMNVTAKSPEIAEEVNKILTSISPIVAIWLKRCNLHKLLWCYSDFVLIFKRSFDYIWPTWIQFNISPKPYKFLILFLTAILIAGFDKFSQLKDISITVIMDAFPKVLNTFDAKYIGEVALYVYNNYYLLKENESAEESNNEEECVSEETSFEFFKPL